MCKRDLKPADVERLFDHFSQNMEWICKHCGYRLIVLIGFSRLFLHGFRKVQRG